MHHFVVMVIRDDPKGDWNDMVWLCTSKSISAERSQCGKGAYARPAVATQETGKYSSKDFTSSTGIRGAFLH